MKKSKLLLVSWILGVLYTAYIVYYFLNGINTPDAAQAIGAGIAAALVTPHMLVTALATLFNILGWAMNKRGFALTGGILYAVAILLFPMYFMFVTIQTILSFVGYAKMKKTV